MAYTAGAAQVGITPDFRSFHVKIDEQLQKEDATFAKAGDRWGKLAADAFTARFGKAKVAPAVRPQLDDDAAKAGLDELGRKRTPEVKPDVDDAGAKAKLDGLARTRTATVRVKVSGLKEAASGIEKAFGNLKVPALGAAAIGLAPSALGLGAGAVGAGAAFGAAAAGVASYAAIAVPMFTKITKAQTALTAAEKAYSKATTSSARKTALKEEAAATAGLTSSEKRLATELTALESGWRRLSAAQEPVVAKSLTPWFSAAETGMKFLPSLVRPAASAIGALGGEAKTALQAPFWGKFFSTLGSIGEESITGFGDALGHMGDGFAHLFVTFAPDIGKLPGLINSWARSFDTWAQHYSRSGLDNFIKKTFSPANMASLKGDLKSLGTVFGNVATATERMSPAAFTGLSHVLEVLAKLTPNQIEALALIYGGAKTAQSVGSAASGLQALLGLGAGGKAAKTAEGAAKDSKLKKFGNSGLGTLLAVPAVAGVLSDTPSGKVNPGGGKKPYQGDWWNNPFGMPGPNDKKSSGNWLTSFSPYENLPTKTIPKLWSGGYEGFMRDIGSPVAAWFSQSLPHFFTSVIPRLWSGAYEGFMKSVGSPVSNWFSQSLPHFFTGVIPRLWSGAYEGFMRSIGSPVANWVTSTLPHFFTSLPGKIGSAGLAAGRSIITGIGNGFSAAGGWLTGQLGKVKGWVTREFSGAVSWLRGTGSSIVRGLGNGIASLGGWLEGVAGRGKKWVTSKFSGAVGWLKGTGQNIVRGLGNGIAALGGWLEGIAGRAKGWITSRFSGAAGWLRNAGSNAIRGLGNGLASLGGWVRGIAGRAKGWITGAFSGAGRWLYSIGASIMNGLASGLNAAIGGVEKTLRWVTSHIPSWKGPPSYDAVLLKPAAQLIMGGFASELAAGIPGVKAVMGQATAAVSAGLNVPSVTLPSVPKVRGLDGASLNLTYTGPQQGLVAEIVKELRADIGGKSGGDVQAHLGKGKVRT